MEQATIQIIAIIAVISALLGWVVRTVLIYFMERNTEKGGHIISLVQQNQENVTAFRETINHHQTKMTTAVEKLADNIDTQTEGFKQLIKK